MSDEAVQWLTSPVEVPADVLIVSADAELIAQRAGFSEHECAELRLAVRELASNLLRHAGSGTMTVSADGSCVTIESVDHGPGIASVNEAVADGFSTAGSLGYGLGTVNRLMDEVSITSALGKGTTVRAHRTHRELEPAVRGPLDIGVATMPKPGFAENGDGYVIRMWGSTALVAVIDGVGHGAPAHAAAQAARVYLEAHADIPMEAIFRGVGVACRGTRGVVMAVARFDRQAGSLEFASVGNIESHVLGTRTPMSFIVRRGIIGVNAPDPKVSTSRWPSGGTLVLHSDGVASHWDDDAAATIASLSATAGARELLVRYGKLMDDATVLVVKPRG
jgi:anti-sigma regulatory factor (Ser/Thr protein kinase)/serine/threonine protein phosphatase PrpC